MKSWEDWRPPVRRLLAVFENGGDVDIVEQLQSSLCSLIDRESTRAVATIRNSLLHLEDELLVEAVESNFELHVEIEDASELPVCLEKDTAVDSKAGAVVVADGTVCRNQFSIDWTITAACRY